MAEEDEFEEYDTSMFNSLALDSTKKATLEAGEIIPKIQSKPTKKGKTVYNLKLLLICPPGLLSQKPMDQVNVNFEYNLSPSLNN